MLHRIRTYILLGGLTGISAAILAAIGEATWIIFASVFILTVIYGLIKEALREPVILSVEKTEPVEKQLLPAGFGRAMLEQMPLPLLIISPRGRVVFGNKAAKVLLPNLSTGEHFANLFRVPAFVEAVNEALAGKRSSKVMFTDGIDGELYYEARIGLLPAGSEFGSKVQAIVQIEDRTQDRRVEKMRSDFVANASHELRTPLASILGYIETLQGHAKDDPVAREEFLEIMAKQAGRMQRLVDDLMSLSRIEMNEHIRPQDRCDLHDVTLEAVAVLLPIQKKYDVVLECTLEGDELIVAADRDQLSQVLVNLIDNAMKYGGENKVVKVYIIEDADRVGVTIADQGEGIAPKHLTRLTERFYRVNAAQSRNKGGTGLGLAIVKHIVNRHGGELQIESIEGEGSRFTVWLPKTA